MASQNQFTINGVIDTSKPVLQNIQTIASCAGSWATYDVNDGLWSVVINQTGSSIKSFNDDNIIGNITVSGTGIRELYNKVELEFPHRDLRDRIDYVTYSIPSGSRFPNEADNTLNIQFDLVNDPVQAELLAVRELKQSRVDKVIQFRTDFTSLGLKAGDLIDVTSSMLGYTAKVFRIISIQEEDSSDNVLSLAITALEYDADVYSTAGLEREQRSVENEILAKENNLAAKNSDNASAIKNLTDGVGNPLNALLVSGLLSALSKGIGGGGGSITALTAATFTATPTAVQNAFNSFVSNPEPFSTTGAFSNVSSGQNVEISFSLNKNLNNAILYVQSPVGDFDFITKINGTNVTRTDVTAFIPCNIALFYNGSLLQESTVDWQTQNSFFQIPSMPAGNYQIFVSPLPTYDLNQETSYFIMPYNYRITPQASGAGITCTLYAFNT